MKKLLYCVLAAVAVVCSCVREQEPEGSVKVPSSEYLVISAECSSMTRSDIREGKSSWEAGDKIAVVYKGSVYEYVAGTPSADGRQTYFTSSAGISNYDGSGLTAYYQAIDAAAGRVGIVATRDISFQKSGQVNSACAPLVGVSSSLKDGVLNMAFNNIFSVIELRIDAGSHLNSPAKTLKIEPAAGGTFSGYITCTGTVDPSTLAVTTLQTGTSLVLNLPEGTDLRQAQTLKFPVGRFTSSKGLKVTLTLEDGREIVKEIYKSGLSTFRESGGQFEVMHLARAMYAFAGILADVFPAKWQFSDTTWPIYKESWTGYGFLPSTSSSLASISVVRAEANAAHALSFDKTLARPKVGNLLKDDCWLWDFPVDHVPAGSYMTFNLTLAGDRNSPKYYIVEYLDGGVWKQASHLRTASENSAVKYSFLMSGVEEGGSYQYSNYTQILKFENEVRNGALHIRCRVASDISCSGGTVSAAAADGTCSLAPMSFEGSYVNYLGTKTPKDTRKILCIGNSFSFYSAPSWMLTEIAFCEGHKIDMFGHFKGSQTLGQHCELSHTAEAINLGGYDYAFIQDQSQAHAKYASDKAANADILDYTRNIKNKILAKSPDCKILLENTWSYPGSSYGGYVDYDTFDNLLATGAKDIAGSLGLDTSPIGPAFRKARADCPEVPLYHSDNKHQSVYGAYLKACVNYLVLYGEPFGSSPADCGLNPSYTSALRKVAESVVLYGGDEVPEVAPLPDNFTVTFDFTDGWPMNEEILPVADQNPEKSDHYTFDYVYTVGGKTYKKEVLFDIYRNSTTAGYAMAANYLKMPTKNNRLTIPAFADRYLKSVRLDVANSGEKNFVIMKLNWEEIAAVAGVTTANPGVVTFPHEGVSTEKNTRYYMRFGAGNTYIKHITLEYSKTL